MVSRVVIIDDVPLFRDGMAAAISPARDFRVVDSGATSGSSVSDCSKPDIVLMGISQVEQALKAISSLAARFTSTNIICLTAQGAEAHVPMLLRAGARGCVPRTTTRQELLRCIELVQNGSSYVSPSLAAALLGHQQKPAEQAKAAPAPAPASHLTNREREILRYVAKGLTNRDIARQLSLSEKTVKRYMTFIMQKIQVRNRLQAALYLGEDSSANDASEPSHQLRVS